MISANLAGDNSDSYAHEVEQHPEGGLRDGNVLAALPGPPHKVLQLVQTADARRQQAGLERVEATPALRVDRRLTSPAGHGECPGSHPARVQVRIRLQQPPEVARASDRMLQPGRRQDRARIGRQTLEEDLFEQVLQPGAQVHRGVLVHEPAEPRVRHPAVEPPDRQLQPGPRRLALLERAVARHGKHGRRPRGTASTDTRSAYSRQRPVRMTRSTQCWLQGGCCSSTNRLCESTHTNSSALVTFVLTVSSELYRPNRRTGSELSEPALRLLYVEVDVCERIVSCWIAILMSSRPPPPHGILAGVARCREREWFELARDLALRLVTPAASRSSGSGPKPGPPVLRFAPGAAPLPMLAPPPTPPFPPVPPALGELLP
uniref:Uncharacterized protein n=1 Tax=Anopheles atroparvus TaxID=41427 RepID=A0A182J3X4_ANOAO